MKHYIKPHAEGKDVEAIPEKKVGKRLKDIEEHGNIDVVSRQTGMLCHKGYELSCKFTLIKKSPLDKSLVTLPQDRRRQMPPKCLLRSKFSSSSTKSRTLKVLTFIPHKN